MSTQGKKWPSNDQAVKCQQAGGNVWTLGATGTRSEVHVTRQRQVQVSSAAEGSEQQVRGTCDSSSQRPCLVCMNSEGAAHAATVATPVDKMAPNFSSWRLSSMIRHASADLPDTSLPVISQRRRGLLHLAAQERPASTGARKESKRPPQTRGH